MALHRDIHWIGRQWAVTGYGMQLIDQKLKGFFDIEAIRLWEDGLIEAMHAKEWLNRADFDKGLSIARTRYSPAQGNVTQPLQATVLPAPANGRIASMPQAAKSEAPKSEAPKSEPSKSEPSKSEPSKSEVPKPEAPKLQRLDPIVTAPKTIEAKKPEPVRPKLEPAEPPKPASPKFHVQFTGSAKFVRPWRVMPKR
jgi:hypothetical protein